MVPDVAAIDRRFDYEVPERWRDVIDVGWRVRIPLHGRRVAAWVEALDPADPVEGVELRALTGVSGMGPPPAVFDLARWASWRWAGPLSTLLRAASPDNNVWSLPRLADVALPGTPALTASGGGTDGHRAGPLIDGWTGVVRMAPVNDPRPVIDTAVGLGRPGSVVVLVPSVGWADRLSVLLARQGYAVTRDWAEARAGWPVVVGTRSAAWAPVPRLAAAVVLDAHDTAYRSGWPAFDAAEVLAERASREGAPCALVSPCPTVVQLEGRPLSTVPRDTERNGWPPVTVVDRRRDDPRTGLYSAAMVEVVHRALDARTAANASGQGPVVCVLHRTGRARLLACTNCGELARCERCGRSVERLEDRLRCRGCGTERAVVCASCGATRLKVLRVGVSRVREELEALFKVPVREVSGPASPARPSARALGTEVVAEDLPDATTPVVVGTEAVLHRLRRAACVIFLDFDQHLLAPRFGASEDSLALLARAGRMVGGRHGRLDGSASGTIVVQTRLPAHPAVVAAVHGDPAVLSLPERAVRADLDLPPVTALASLAGEGAGAAAAALGAVAGLGVSESGPDRVTVIAPDHRVLCDALAAMERPPGTLRVTVDPTDL